MGIEIVDPRLVPGWNSILSASGDHSFFHSSSWAAVLAESYRYRPLYLASRDEDGFSLVMPLMEVRSRLTGTRGISLPFTDQCTPFVRKDSLLQEALGRVLEYGRAAGWDFVEWRDGGLPAYSTYFTHDLSLEKSEEALFSNMKASNRRSVRKAVREGVTVSFDGSMDSLNAFYRLHCQTRKRHGLPPQPHRFFKRIHEHILAKRMGIVALARHAGHTVAASVLFMSDTQANFKYGASDLSYQRLRPNNLIIWETMRWLKKNGSTGLNLGRTDPEDPGLLRFKRSWGGSETLLTYQRYSFRREAYAAGGKTSDLRSAKLLSRMPIPLLRLVGRLAYRHMG